MAPTGTPNQIYGMLSVQDAEILLAEIDLQFMTQYEIMAGSPLIEWTNGLIDVRPVSSAKLRMPWQEVMEGFREWEGADKYWRHPIVRDMVVETRPFETSIELDRRNGLPAALARIINLMDNLARAVALYRPRLAAMALLNGEAAGASYKGYQFYDGVPAFSAVHPVNVDDGAAGPLKTWANLFPGRPLKLETLEEAIHDFALVRSPDGESMACYPTHLIVPGTLSQTGRRLVGNKMIGRLLTDNAAGSAAASEDNVRAPGEIKLVVAHQLTAGFPRQGIPGEPNNWYLVDMSPGHKPITMFELQAPLDMPENGMVKGNHPMIRWGKEASGSVAITQPWYIQKNKA